MRHADGRSADLRLVRAGALLCEVADEDHTLPTPPDSRPGDERGRGLRVVSSLAREWGASRTAGGKTVRFELALP